MLNVYSIMCSRGQVLPGRVNKSTLRSGHRVFSGGIPLLSKICPTPNFSGSGCNHLWKLDRRRTGIYFSLTPNPQSHLKWKPSARVSKNWTNCPVIDAQKITERCWLFQVNSQKLPWKTAREAASSSTATLCISLIISLHATNSLDLVCASAPWPLRGTRTVPW